MSKLTREEVLKLAQLARLALSEEEIDEFARELSEILQYVEQLQQVDISGLTPTNQVTGLVNVMRDDVVHDYGYAPSTLMNNVPQKQDGHIKVKRMIA